MLFKIYYLSFALFVGTTWCLAQSFPPQAGFLGSTAIHKDSSVFVAWAKTCTVTRGPIRLPGNASYPQDSLANFGADTNAIDSIHPDLTFHVVSLGDGGSATLTFHKPITNGDGPDFAVFENGFMSGGSPYDAEAAFLELAFVEVSSDGETFVRFPSVNEYHNKPQLGGFAVMNARYLHNLAGKYIAGYGTPFDLADLVDSVGINIDSITHVRVVDVVGNMDPLYATYDSHGNPVNDPWPTPFWTSAFDLAGVGVIHQKAVPIAPIDSTDNGTPSDSTTTSLFDEQLITLRAFPNPASRTVTIQTSEPTEFVIRDVVGKTVVSGHLTEGNNQFSVEHLTSGVYFISTEHTTVQFIINNNEP